MSKHDRPLRSAMATAAAVAVALILMLAACGHATKFKVQGTLAANETVTLRAAYYDGHHLVSEPVAAREGRFEIEGTLLTATTLDLFTHDGALLATLYVQPGQTVKARLNLSDRPMIEIDDDDDQAVNTRWAQFLHDNAQALTRGDAKHVNYAIEQYIAQHPDDVVSTMMLTRLYDGSLDPTRAVELYQSLDPAARTEGLAAAYSMFTSRFLNQADTLGTGLSHDEGTLPQFDIILSRDSVFTFNPAEYRTALVAFTQHKNDGRPDSMARVLRRLDKKYTDKQLKIVDVSLDFDTINWRRTVRYDSATWVQGWLPGGITPYGLRGMAIPTLPYFMAVDSAGNTLYAGPEMMTAIDKLTKKLR